MSKGAKSRRLENPTQVPLTETPSANYEQRTERNVPDTGGNAIFSIDPELTGGTKMMVEFPVIRDKRATFGLAADTCPRHAQSVPGNAVNLFANKKLKRCKQIENPEGVRDARFEPAARSEPPEY